MANALAVFGALLLLWQLVIWIFHVPPYMLPSPWAVAKAVVEAIPVVTDVTCDHRRRIAGRPHRQRRRWRAGRPAFRSVALGAEHAVPVYDPAPNRSHHRHRSDDPVVGRHAGGPAVTLIAFIISLAPVIANTTQGLISVDENLVNLFLMHNASPAQVVLKLRLPHAVPSLFVGIRIASGIAVIGALTGELFAGSSQVGQGGLGYSILYSSSQNADRLHVRARAGDRRLGIQLSFSW